MKKVTHDSTGNVYHNAGVSLSGEHPLIEFRNITKSFGEKRVLNRVNLSIYKGEITTIIGKSGTGKSVLLKHMIGLMEPDMGDVCFNGKNVAKLKGRERLAHIRQMSYMFQNNALFDSMTVFDNVAFPLRQTTSLSETIIRNKVMDILEKTDLQGFADKFPSELSGGMQKRVAFSRALVTDPSIVLFDEPTTGQDLIRRNAILSMISEYKNRFGFTAVIISHDIPDVLFISNRILVLHEGEIVFQGTPGEFDSFDHPYVDEFVHSLETFRDHMPGLYSRRNFQLRYNSVLGRKSDQDAYVVAIFSISGFRELCEKIGHATAHELVKELGAIISRHFDAVGGFSTRQRRSRFMTVLPFSNIEESRQMLDDFANELREKGFEYVKLKNREAEGTRGEFYKITVIAGMAEGQSTTEGINDVLKKARQNLFEIGRFQCIEGKCSL
ncbi:ABC-type transport system involved in resistance to organic solvents, ATPase component [Desulfamplus magnetovallimortis]|uniref:ABC-type transport system involved in resistance to organic solvents, ATPase component n=1 Tax=Desulfamplus magnetovallimortis TaxID=1246637 RepID=A0A1W1H6W7_9BACT|nr:ATP-binding cassette domain-containing protein [Desulfamplus magnetovallimortis]SLM28118.1 ABC-type transport system involved in resistance to organic solvents, ATPase component [Desulfamplus magnetovallimortis]